MNAEGVEAPCLGIGIGMALVGKCVRMSEEQGFVRVTQVGYSGLTVGTEGADDAKITAVAEGSPAAAAGLKVGDVIAEVDGKAATLTPGMAAYSRLFGAKGQAVTVTVEHAGVANEIKLVRAGAPAPANQPKGSMLLIVHPLMDWRGQFVPCMGGGPAAALSFAYCNKLFEPHGYVKTSELGTTGITVDTDAADKALIKAVDAGSPAAAAGVQVGDEVVAVNGKPLTASVGQNAMVLLFGKVGRTDQVTVVRGGARQTVQMTLAEKPKG